jgi:benzoate/toluate 1,2-dioxygenase alpha subunit
MVKVPRFESYRGFLFGSLNADVLPLREHLGETAKLIDLMVDQSADGLEVLKGASTYTYDGNWKVQTENGADGYHVASTHWNYGATTARRLTGDSATETKAMDPSSYGKQRGGFYAFEHGHVLLWTFRANPEDEPLYERRAELIERVGQTEADWAINVARNLCLYPNVYLMDQFSSQIRQYRPIAVDKTEVTIHCIAPVGESAQARAARIRRYEDFFNATGMATPDDLEEFRASQNGYLAAPSAPWNDMSRGATHWIEGPDEDARAMGFTPLRSGVKVEDEGLYPIQHRYWQTAMQQAVVAESKARSL